MTDNTCAKCGACTAVCPVYQVTGLESLTARGRLHLLEKMGADKHSRAYLDIFAKCLLCDACRHVCPRKIDLVAKVVELRGNYPHPSGPGAFARSLVKGCLSHRLILAGIGKVLKISAPLLEKLPADSGLRLKLGLAAAEDNDRAVAGEVAPKPAAPAIAAKSMLFPGCYARYLAPEITSATTGLVAEKEASPAKIPDGQVCCGLAFYSSGDLEKARHLARLNIAAFAGSNMPIIVPCGSCFSHLSSYPELMVADCEWHPRAIAFVDRLRELGSFLADQPPPADRPGNDRDISPEIKVFYHDPCHTRARPNLKKAARQLLGQLPGVQLVELANGPQCCGFGGLFNLAHPDISAKIGGRLLKEILAVAPDLVVTTCSGCLIQLRQLLAAAGSPAKVRHLTQVLTEKGKK